MCHLGRRQEYRTRPAKADHLDQLIGYNVRLMNQLASYLTRWKWCALSSMAMVLLSLMPQIHLWVIRGLDWNGAYVSAQGDEPLYSAYVNALIDGRTRKNDPFGGKDSSASAPLPESLFSIQFVPAYLVALPARAFGASASTAFIVLIGVAALFASLSVFWLLNCITGDHRVASAGTLFVLCLGALAGGHGLLGVLFKADLSIPSLPFLRRYEPAVAFPLFFIFQIEVWRTLTSQSKRAARVSSIIAALTMAVLIFSYLYLWTAAAAWLACIGILWFYFRPSDRRKTLVGLVTISAIAAIALLPYVYMLSRRAATLEAQQTLISTHRPDLFAIPEIIGTIILIVLVVGVLRSRIERTNSRFIYAISLALLPFVVFNQQVLTGKTMQVYHFEVFVVNYSTLVGIIIIIALLWKSVPRRLLIWMAALSFVWGFMEVGLPSRLAFVPAATVKDQTIPALLRLKELSRQDGTVAQLRTVGQASALVFSPDVALIALLPTWTSQGTLLDVTGVDCGSVTREGRKRFFYLHLYYSKVETEALRNILNSRDQFARSVIFGHERLFPALSSHFKPVQPDEIEREVQAYHSYLRSFSREEVVKRPITYAVMPVEGNFDFANLDRWYERDAGEHVGAYILYRLKLRN
jgi:hypothetical protein